MAVTVIIPLKPGRYVVRGGPRGDTVTQHVMRDLPEHGPSQALRNGRRVSRNTARDNWPVLASFRVRPGHTVTCYGVLDAVGRVWRYGS